MAITKISRNSVRNIKDIENKVLDIMALHKTENKIISNESIALVGMPGSGKSSIGRLAAKKLGYEFIDSDELIEQEAGCSIPEIFEKKGESWFRTIEASVISEVLSTEQKPFILSTGGGAIMTAQVHKELLDKSLLFFLEASLETLWEHVSASYGSRPLLSGDGQDAQKKLRTLLEQRTPVYKQAHIILNCDNTTLEEMANKLVTEITQHG